MPAAPRAPQQEAWAGGGQSAGPPRCWVPNFQPGREAGLEGGGGDQASSGWTGGGIMEIFKFCDLSV